MGGQATFVKFLLIAIAIILVVGFYLTIDAMSVVKVSREKLADEVRSLKAEIGALRAMVEKGGPVAAQSAAGRAGPRPKFANEDLRDPKAVDGDAIVSVTSTVTPNMNNIVNNDGTVAGFWGLANDSCAERNYAEPTRFEPKLATHWEISEDKKVYTIHLRKGVLWHDATDPVTGARYRDVEVAAEDFKFFADVIMNPKIPCDPIRSYFKDLDRIEVVDRYTFKVHWKKRYFLSKSLSLGLSPLPKHFYRFDPNDPDKGFTENHERNRMIVGCGPWIFEKPIPGKQYSFRRNEKYYGPKPYLKRRIVKIIQEPNARLQALRKGEIDTMGLRPNQWLDQTNDEKFEAKWRKIKYSGRFYNYIGYNMRRELFKDRRVRLALTHLVNRERIRDEVYRGLARIQTGNFWIESPYYDHSVKPWPFDIEKAKKLLAEAGWRDTDGDGVLDKDGKKFEFVFSCITQPPEYLRIAEIMAQDCKKAGIRVTINPYEWSVYLKRIEEKNFDAVSLGWGMGYESDPYQLWHSSHVNNPRTSNHCGFANAEADRIIEEGRREFDIEKRIALYRRFHRLLHEEQPYTFLMAPYTLTAIDRRFRNVKVYPLGLYTDAYWVHPSRQKYRE